MESVGFWSLFDAGFEHKHTCREKEETRVFGIGGSQSGVIPHAGAVFGFVARGTAVVDGVAVGAEHYFVTDTGAVIETDANSAVVAIQHVGFKAIPSMGGPLERVGRLRYIDGCSDTLLVAPPRRGDPCLNHLHFPARVDQTAHTHPSIRCGIVVRGRGICRTLGGDHPLLPGYVWLIPTGVVHSFHTVDETMDVIAYHPDSDFGPEDETHPMINRTLVGGAKIDNTTERHLGAEVETGRFWFRDEGDTCRDA